MIIVSIHKISCNKVWTQKKISLRGGDDDCDCDDDDDQNDDDFCLALSTCS